VALPNSASGNVLSFAPVTEGVSLSVYGSDANGWEVRISGAPTTKKTVRADAEALVTEIAEAVGDIVYELTV
jgi:hypothetical protein